MTIEIQHHEDFIEYIFPSDKDYERLKLLVILSPIFIASFDNGDRELEYLKETIENSNFPYGLYPHYFDGFDLDNYQNYYATKDYNEDIYLDKENNIHFKVNQLEDVYINALGSLIEALILDDEARNYYLYYFAKMRDDIVINGRRSILANGIQAFYLSKYVVVWMMDLCEYVMKYSPQYIDDIKVIYHLANMLKSPRNNRRDNDDLS